MAKKLLITVIVMEAFQDKFDHKTQYPVGAEDLVSRGLAKIKEVPKDAKSAGNAAPSTGDNPETKPQDE